eukprot:371538_1
MGASWKYKSYFTLVLSSFLFVSAYILWSIKCVDTMACVRTPPTYETYTISHKSALIDRISNKNVILTFCNDKFMDVFDFWYSFYVKLSDLTHDTNYLLLLVALDNKSYYLFDESVDQSASNIFIVNALHIDVTETCSIPSDLIQDDFFNEEAKLARFRHCIVKTLLVHTQSITMTDIDALWLRNPFPYFAAHEIDNNQVDIISSTGTFPHNCHSLHRTDDVYIAKNYCMGFVHFRNTFNTNILVSKFWDEIRRSRNYTGSDQQPFNCFIYHHMKRRKQFYDTKRNVSVAKYSYKNTDTKTNHLLAIPLSQKLFVRNCRDEELETNDIYILHCWMDKYMRAELQMNATLPKLGYWIDRLG